MKQFILLLTTICLSFSVQAQAQTQLRNIILNETDLPENAVVKGVFKAGRLWDDKNGVNYFLVGITEPQEGKDGGKTIKLHAIHYAGKEGEMKVLREFNDFIEDCELDYDLSVIEGSLSVTDADGDGKGEVMFMYRLGCYGDVSPIGVKLLMTENGQKYPIRGSETLYMGKTKTGGEKTIGVEFNDAPALKKVASAHWDKFCPNQKM